MKNKSDSVRNSLYMVLSIAMAIGIWFYVDEVGSKTASMTITDIPIEYLNSDTVLADRSLMLMEGEDSGTDAVVDLTFSGPRRLVVQLDRSKVRVTADLSAIAASGKQMVGYKTSFTDRKFSDDKIQVTESSFYLATVNVCELSRKEIEIRCDLIGNVADGYSAERVQIAPVTMEIRGRAEDLAPVSYAKVVLDIGEDAKETVEQTLSYSYYDRFGKKIENASIRSNVESVDAVMPVSMIKELQLEIDFQEAPGAKLAEMDWDLQPKSVLVSGDAAILKNIDAIVLDDFDLTSVREEPATHSYSIVMPEGCENLNGVTRATLQISYPSRSTASIVTTRFRYENPPRDKHLQLLTEEMTVSAFGTDRDIQLATGEDVVIVADLSECTDALGSYTVPAWPESENGLDLGFYGTYKVRVTIRESAPEDPEGPEEPGIPENPENGITQENRA